MKQRYVEQDKYGSTPLMYASEDGHKGVVMKLLVKGANPTHR